MGGQAQHVAAALRFDEGRLTMKLILFLLTAWAWVPLGAAAPRDTQSDTWAATDTDWMVLLVDSDQSAKTGRHGFDSRVNQSRSNPDTASVERWTGKTWDSVAAAMLQVGINELHLTVERAVLGFSPGEPLRFDFKWTDNIPANADAIESLDHGDTASNAQFNFRHETAPR